MRSNNPSIVQTSGVSSVPHSEISKAARHQSNGPSLPAELVKNLTVLVVLKMAER
jgi:hypothetical protein